MSANSHVNNVTAQQFIQNFGPHPFRLDLNAAEERAEEHANLNDLSSMAGFWNPMPLNVSPHKIVTEKYGPIFDSPPKKTVVPVCPPAPKKAAPQSKREANPIIAEWNPLARSALRTAVRFSPYERSESDRIRATVERNLEYMSLHKDFMKKLGPLGRPGAGENQPERRICCCCKTAIDVQVGPSARVHWINRNHPGPHHRVFWWCSVQCKANFPFGNHWRRTRGKFELESVEGF